MTPYDRPYADASAWNWFLAILLVRETIIEDMVRRYTEVSHAA